MEGQGWRGGRAGRLGPLSDLPLLSTSQREERSPAWPSWSSAQVLPWSARLAVLLSFLLGCGSGPAHKLGGKAASPAQGARRRPHSWEQALDLPAPLQSPLLLGGQRLAYRDLWTAGEVGQRRGPYPGVGGRELSFSVRKRIMNSEVNTSGAEQEGTGGFFQHPALLHQLVPLGNSLASLSLSFSLTKWGEYLL